MIKNIIASIALSIISTQAFALDVLCVDRELQDSQITAHFTGKGPEISVRVGIPTGETSSIEAIGSCVSEEDTSYLSLRCDEVVTADGEKYFARIDGNQARVAKEGKILSTIPCDSSK